MLGPLVVADADGMVGRLPPIVGHPGRLESEGGRGVPWVRNREDRSLANVDDPVVRHSDSNPGLLPMEKGLGMPGPNRLLVPREQCGHILLRGDWGAQCIAVSCVVRLYCDRVLAIGRLIPQELNPEGRHLITRVNAGVSY